MTSQERIDRVDGLYRLLINLRGDEFGGHPECSEVDPEVFFPEPGQKHLVKVAKAICDRCPVMESCRELAIRNHEHGIWGGTTEAERVEIRKSRQPVAEPDEPTEEVAA